MDIGGRDSNHFHIIDIAGKIDRLKDSIVLKSYVNTLLERNLYYVGSQISLAF